MLAKPGFELTPGEDVEAEVETKLGFELTPGEDVEANETVLIEEPIFELIPGECVEDAGEANNIVITEDGLDELLGVVGGKGFW